MMQGTNVLFGQIAVVFGIVIAGVWAPRNGQPPPWAISYALARPGSISSVRRSITRGGCSSGGSSSMPMRRACSTSAAPSQAAAACWPVVVAIGMSIWRSRQSPVVTTTARRWAKRGRHLQGGPHQPAGVFLGQHDQPVPAA